MADNINDIIAVQPSPDGKPNSFVSTHNPVRMGNTANIAYGGCAQALAVSAAAATVDVDTYKLYSLVGHFLGAASTELKLHAQVTAIRDTRTFATRFVVVSQISPKDNKPRSVLSAQLDFHRRETATLKTFSTPVPALASSLSESWDRARATEEQRGRPGNTPQLIALYERSFLAGRKFFEQRTVPNSIHTQNMYGLLKKLQTTQDDLHLTDKASFDWTRSATPLHTSVDSLAALAFWMDGGIAFVPLTHDHQFLTDAAAASSLDFALRIFVNDFDFNEWHLKSIQAVTAGEGRSFGQAKMWDQSGRLVAEMSQQCILRPHKKEVKL